MATTPTNTNLNLLTTAEAAELLNTPAATLRGWRHQGIGPTSFSMGALVRYRREDIMDWLNSRYQQSARGSYVNRQAA